MPTLKIYGASDDLIECEGIPGADEFNVYCEQGDLMATLNIGGKLRIHAIYDDQGCWSFAVAHVDDAAPFPDWPIRTSAHASGYSTVLEIDVPEGVSMCCESA